ncbi:cell division protein ZapA [Hellea balneolensis]|uniref:cell division protein ZapA n=1 Tax=Hellea balneolensis TaxID=287478 RepID=UPI0004245F70|nr:cell division protein ZapA [Hellea balneolensis]
MAKVSLNINGRKYALGCDDGEEERLMRLGQKLDDRVNNMANQFGQIGDLRLLVMAGITMLDELEDMDKSVDNEVDKRIGNLRKETTAATQLAERTELKAADSLLDAAMRIERLAERLSDKG